MGSVGSDTLKPGWTPVAFGDVVRQVKDRVDPDATDLERYVAGEHMDTDELRIRRWGVIGDGYLGPAFHMHFRPGHVLYGSRRTYLRKVAVADFEGITANTTFVIEPKDPKVLMPELLPFIMQTESFHEHSIRQSKGSVNPYINFSDLTWYEFLLPPLDEQRRIAELFSACEHTINSHRTLATEADRTYLARLLCLFVPQTKSAASACTAPTGTRWEWTRVEECFELQLGKMSSKKAREGREQASYIKNNNVLWDGFVLDDLPRMSFSGVERRKFSLHPGDLIVCEGGEIGRSAIWADVGREIVYQKALHRLRPRDGSVLPRFFLHYLRYCATAGELEKIATGTTILHLPQERLGALRFPFPDTETQESIVEQLDAVSHAADRARQREDAMRSVKLMLMQKTLTR